MIVIQNITKIDVIILQELFSKNKRSFINSISYYDLKILEVVKANTAYKRLLFLEKIGLIKKGVKISKKNGYYITDLGVKELELMKEN